MISITKKFKFDAAHRLPYYDGACNRLHGHSFKLEVEVTGQVQDQGPKTGMIMDFTDLKRMVNTVILCKVDHTDLNDEYINPTAENMIYDFAVALKQEIRDCRLPITLVRLRLYETDDSYAEWRQE